MVPLKSQTLWLERIGGGTRGGTGDVKRDGGGDVNDVLPFPLWLVSKVFFPSFASEFSSSYGCTIFLSQLLYSAALFMDGGRLNSWYI